MGVAFQFDVLEQDAFEILHLIRLWRNRVAPVNRIPSEILALIPDFWNKYYDGRDRDLVALTHVCRAWREVFISRSSLWTNLDCENKDQARVYLERSKSLPINLSLRLDDRLPFPPSLLQDHPPRYWTTQIPVHRGTAGNLQDIAGHLSRPAPLLEKLSIRGYYHDGSHLNPVLTPALFNGDLSSLRSLRLESVRTKLPWRNMVNLTSLKLFLTSPGGCLHQGAS
jgi:hypothetical protein